MLPARRVACQARSIASGVGAYRVTRRGAVRTKSSPTGPAEHDEGGSLSMKCQHRDLCVGFELVWHPLVSSAEMVRIVDTARLRVDGVLLFAADAPLKAAAQQQQQTPHLAASDDGLRERRDNDQGDNGRDDIPAQVGKFLVDSLQRHFVWVVEVVDAGGWCPRSGW